MLIGLISDIHGQLPDVAKEALADCNAIICAGDTESQSAMLELQCIAPTVAVYGNCDRFVDYGRTVHDVAKPSFEGVKFYVVHRPEDIRDVPANVDVIVHGHTHIPRDEEIDGVLYLNPGSPTEPRGGSEPSIMKVVVEEREVVDVQRFILTPFGPQKVGDNGRSANTWDDFDYDEEDDHTHFDFAELGF